MRKLLCIVICILLFMLMPFAAYATEENSSEGDTCTEHSYSSWAPSGDGHSRSCTVCGNTESGSHSASGWTPGDQGHTGSCSVCSAPMSGSHSFSAWNVSGEGHARSCTLCGASETSDRHMWNDGTVTTPATCVTSGVKTFTCAVCPATRTETIAATEVHTYTVVQASDASGHTLKCKDCPDVKAPESHSWDAGTVETAATCLLEGKRILHCTKCTVTKDEVIPKAAHTLSAWTEVEGKHTRSCTVAGCTYKEIGEHTYDNECDKDCNVCSLTREPLHKFSTTLSRNSSEHWYACTLCGEKKDAKKHVPGPAATEEKAQLCLTCGYEMMPKKNHTHKFDKDQWKSDATGHWHLCTGCDVEVEFDDHDYDDTCNSLCSVCGYENENGHIFDGTWESDKNTHWAICKVCDKASKQEDHVPGPEATDLKPQLCTVCGYELVPVQEHTHQLDLPWQFNEADHWKVCECEEKLELSAHNWDEGTKNKDKSMTYTCEDCGQTKTEEPVKKSTGVPWWIFLILMIVCLAGAIVALILLIIGPKQQQGKFANRK